MYFILYITCRYLCKNICSLLCLLLSYPLPALKAPEIKENNSKKSVQNISVKYSEGAVL